MSERDDAYEDLDQAGALDAIRWAHASAYRRVAEDFDPTTGHDQGWVGYTAYKLLSDRLDRVAGCGAFELGSGAEPGAGQDVLALGISQDEFDVMPVLPPGVIERDDLNGSPGWRCGTWRWLLNSFVYGHSDDISWAEKSPTKRHVASAPSPDALTLFDIRDLDPFADQADPGHIELPINTLILAHSMDGLSAMTEIYLGRARYGAGSVKGWHWKIDLRQGPGGSDGGQDLPVEPTGPIGPDTNAVDDAPVRLRRNVRRETGTSG